MLKTLHRRLKRRIYRRDYQRMERLAATCNYEAAALLAVCLGEGELARRYMMLDRARRVVSRSTPLTTSQAVRLDLQRQMQERKN